MKPATLETLPICLIYECWTVKASGANTVADMSFLHELPANKYLSCDPAAGNEKHCGAVKTYFV